MRFIFKVATVFACSIMLIAFLAACGVRTENDDKDSSNVSSTDSTSKEGNGDTDAVISFGSIIEGTESSDIDDISSANNNSNTSSNNTSDSQSSTGNGNDTSDTESKNETTSSGNSNSKVDYNNSDNWTDPV